MSGLLGVRPGPGDVPDEGRRREGPGDATGASPKDRRRGPRALRPAAHRRRQQGRPRPGAPGYGGPELRGGDGEGLSQLLHRADEPARLLGDALHVGHDWQAQGRASPPPGRGAAARHGTVGARPASGRRVLVHGRPRLGDRHRVRNGGAVGHRSDPGRVRGWLRRRPVVRANHGAAGQRLVHRTHRHSYADERGQRAAQGPRSVVAAAPEQCRGAPEPRGRGVGSGCARRTHSRHLVGDGGGRHHVRQLSVGGRAPRLHGQAHTRCRARHPGPGLRPRPGGRQRATGSATRLARHVRRLRGPGRHVQRQVQEGLVHHRGHGLDG